MSRSYSYSSCSQRNATAYINGRVYTVSDASPWAEAFLVGSDGMFEAVGTNIEVMAIALEDGLIIYDLRGKFIMPGIHDAHVYMLLAGVGMTSQALLPMQGLNSTNIAGELNHGSCMCKYAHTNQDWLVGWTYLIENFHRDALDKAYPHTPVVIHGAAGYSMFLNTEALRRAGYSVESEQDGQDTLHLRDGAGRLTGEFAEMAMSKAVTAIPQPSVAHVKRVLKHTQHILHRCQSLFLTPDSDNRAGVTSCQEASANSAMLQALRKVDAEGALKVNMHTHIVYAPDWIAEEGAESLHRLIEDAASFKSEHVDTRFVKIILDEDFRRYKDLNITAEMSPAIFFVHPITESSRGLMHWSFPRMIEPSALITIGSDWCAPNLPDLLPIMSNIVESVGDGDKNVGAARICRILTLAGAEAVGRQDKFGSIERGKKANFIALDNDLSRGEFEGARLLTTWFEGEIVYDEQRA
ncbi:hypothetical protein PV08_06588 [Exophiala spinifera]|uniref:Amidohydrolase 3 domain-containing protein n=1 Tax=Exophiala spinifera TaxID=91928 RepID=A0A0D2BC51_9EURO|nr:uncharacterized protein PV08_06588 [Exophiala spinifera]KIW16533.1 hypothetical protein PV08_06588 [Exophiala spinifera]